MNFIITLICIVLCVALLILLFKWHSSKKFLLNCFDEGNVLVFGLRGRGKDMLFNFVINKRGCKYISNVNYTGDNNFTPLEFDKLDIRNDRSNFVSRDINKYVYPYPDNTDIFISDCGVYFPSYDNNKLNKEYPRIPLFNALSRHLGNCNVHCNIQNIPRLWLTFREQSDIFVKACGCKVFFKKFVFIRYRYYTNANSAQNGVIPFPYSHGIGKEKRMRQAEYNAQNGEIRNGSFWFILPKFKYNDRIFKEILEKNDSIVSDNINS